MRPAVVPSEVGEDGYQFVKNGDMFRVTNLLKEFKITASKVWSDGNGNHSAESVKFLLGSSTTKVLSGVPDDIQWGSDEVTLNEANNWKHEWTKLPGYTKVGNDYKQLYYYIKEIDLATGYEAVYSATAMSKNTDVTVTNVKGLNITNGVMSLETSLLTASFLLVSTRSRQMFMSPLLHQIQPQE